MIEVNSWIAGIIVVVVVLVLILRARSETRLRPPGPQNPGTGNAGVAELMRQGRKIEAVKLYRRTHSVGLTEALKAVERIEHESSRSG